jgi:hypothetical protein
LADVSGDALADQEYCRRSPSHTDGFNSMAMETEATGTFAVLWVTFQGSVQGPGYSSLDENCYAWDVVVRLSNTLN